MTQRLSAFLAADTVWKSRVAYEPSSDAETQFPQHWLVGGRIGVRTEDQRYSSVLFARNLFNEHAPSPFLASGESLLALCGPQSFRRVGLQVDAKF